MTGAESSKNTAESAPARLLRAAPLLAITSAAALAYARVLGGGFYLDDVPGVVEKPVLRELGAFVRSFFLQEALAAGRPVTDLTFALDYRLFGLSAPGFHGTSIGLHLLAGVFAYFAARRLARRAGWHGHGLALFCAGVFALHPMQSQAVSYVSQRAETLASLLYLASFVLLLDADERHLRGRGILAWIAAFAAFVLAVGAKAMALTLPAAYLLVAACIPGDGSGGARGAWRRRLLLIAPFAALSVLAAARQLLVLRGDPYVGFDVPRVGPVSYFLTQWRVMLAYLRLLVWPSGQSIDHEVVASRGVLDPPETLLGGLALAALATSAIVLVVRARRRADASASVGRLVGFGVLWFFVVLAPTSSVIPIVDVMEEHRVYLASFGMAMAAGAGGSFLLTRFAGRHAPAARAAAFTAVLCALAVSLYARNAVWTSGEALWADAVSKSPTKARAHASYARELASANKLTEAIAEYRVALRCASDGSVLRALVLGNMGSLLNTLGRRDEALAALQDALEEAPREPSVEANLAVWHLGGGDVSRAHELAEDAFRQVPHDLSISNVYGVVLMREGRNREALEHFRMARAAGGRDFPPAAFNLAIVEERLGMRPEACAAWASYAQSAASPAADETSRERRRALGCR